MESRDKRWAKALIWWIISILWLALTFYLSNQIGSKSATLSEKTAKIIWQPLHNRFSGLAFGEFHFAIRKFAHFSVHAILAFDLFRATWHSFRRKGVTMFLTLIVACAVAVFDELVQLRAPGRVWAAADTGLNLLGVCIGTCFSSILP